jgi:hypothetical protein
MWVKRLFFIGYFLFVDTKLATKGLTSIIGNQL